MVQRLGIKVPEYKGERYGSDYAENIGMEYEFFNAEGYSTEILIGASHEDVGLVTWYLAKNSQECFEFVEMAKSVEIIKLPLESSSHFESGPGFVLECWCEIGQNHTFEEFVSANA